MILRYPIAACLVGTLIDIQFPTRRLLQEDQVEQSPTFMLDTIILECLYEPDAIFPGRLWYTGHSIDSSRSSTPCGPIN